MSTFAISDLHGRKDLFLAVKNFLSPEDKVYVLGDCGDRGPHGWDIVKSVYGDPQFIYLKGNHEEMLAKAMRGEMEDIDLCIWNGGASTLEGWQREGSDVSWIQKLQNLPLEAVYENALGEKVLLSHAGNRVKEEKRFQRKEDFLWDRGHFDEAFPRNATEEEKRTVIVHGHTPVPLLEKVRRDFHPTEKGAFWYCADENGTPHKVDIDCGSAWTGVVSVLNLDTWDEEVLEIEKKEKRED